MNEKYINRIFTILSVILLLISLTQKAYCVDSNCGDYWSGLMCFLLGIFSLIFSFSGISWLLNPTIIISYIVPLKNLNTKLYLAIASVIFGISFLFFKEIIKDEAGHSGKITGYELGYWLWVLSAITNLVGIVLIKCKRNITYN